MRLCTTEIPVLMSLALGMAAACVIATPVRGQSVAGEHEYLTREQALGEVFPSAETFVSERIRLSPADVAAAEKYLNRKLDLREFEAVLNYDRDGHFVGYSVISEEVGKYRPITFVVGVRPDFRIEKVAVMVYREDRGEEVRMPRFLYQYRGKSTRDAIRTNSDIVNISGATISVRSMNAGVKKVLYLLSQQYRDRPPAATFETGAGSRRIGRSGGEAALDRGAGSSWSAAAGEGASR